MRALRVVPIGIATLISLGGCGAGENGGVGEDGGPSAEAPDALRPAAHTAFDSSERPDLAELSAVAAGFFLPDSGLALVERTEIHLIDFSSDLSIDLSIDTPSDFSAGTTRVVGREGEGPREFRHIGGAKRVPGGIVVSDVPRRRVSVISHDGEFLRSQSVLDAEFGDFFGAYPVGIHPDGRIVFRDGIASMGRDYDGQTWNPATYVTVRDDGELDVLAEASGSEVYFGAKRSGGVVFGHQTHEAVTGDQLIVAATDRGVIAVLDWSGREVAQIPMPAGTLIPDARAVGRQVLLARWQEFAERINRLAASGRIPSEPREFDQSGASEPDLKDWPINEVAPAIDALLTDFDERLWVRDYRLPDQDSVTWRVWDIDRQELLFTARIGGEEELLDARADLVLLRRLDEFDVPRAVVTGLRVP